MPLREISPGINIREERAFSTYPDMVHTKFYAHDIRRVGVISYLPIQSISIYSIGPIPNDMTIAIAKHMSVISLYDAFSVQKMLMEMMVRFNAKDLKYGFSTSFGNSTAFMWRKRSGRFTTVTVWSGGDIHRALKRGATLPDTVA